MGQGLMQANEALLKFERLIQTEGCNAREGMLRIGVDLGTTNVVLAVVDEQNQPVVGASYPSTMVWDGIIVDYTGVVRMAMYLKEQLEEHPGIMLDAGACAIPPGVFEGNVKAIGNVAETAGFCLTNIVDEPTVAFSILGISDDAAVDVGGGTIGISVPKDEKVIFTDDEPTGGTHMTLALASFHGWNTQEAELTKRDPAQEANVFPVIKSVVEKMASIVRNYLWKCPVEAVYVVGGACCSTQFESIFEKFLGVPAIRPAAPLLVTPPGVAVNCKL